MWKQTVASAAHPRLPSRRRKVTPGTARKKVPSISQLKWMSLTRIR
ncbi:MAG: hypothetical protein BWX64_01021 [Acidobacteria bacterium ADurb.Bin051]|nr:MAG: hypothetical protein BWX64_01021 [Acidobacteria bacterium ADurb.Bin051]